VKDWDAIAILLVIIAMIVTAICWERARWLLWILTAIGVAAFIRAAVWLHRWTWKRGALRRGKDIL
jgi:hypothetical protein